MTDQTDHSDTKRDSWDEYFSGLLPRVASRATCDRGMSATIFTRENDVMTTGYVGAPPGHPHCLDVGHLWSPDGKHCVRTLHAEQNAILRAARNGVNLRGTTVYTTMEPCATCAMMLCALNVERVVSMYPYHKAERSREMFRVSGIPVTLINPDTRLYNPERTENG